ncbi:MAG: hypothetical protein L6262_03320 [Weeksellaceae bacterium]|nr:hypothetical protein [Weeksellaceae bacterium]
MKYTLVKRNKSFRADSPSQFIGWMRKMDLQSWKDNQEFMEGYAYRKMTFENIRLRYDNENNFVEDLIKNNLLKVEDSKGFLGVF